ncbi:DUF4785 domain-containing protein [Thermomonas sp.]|uniref:DUF4785 domain-containing protein n=1 Tax=Thermomonas sp. TaxID=1971895 RepID=UPI00261118C6|nr:DUF4785 domain-containing protein [Thermomonas sp.]MCO5055864.1 DUF4785 family protein [Thermomonas sp.]HRO62891.1 DUF4785 domain-containing protein [Thermomonas sp.]
MRISKLHAAALAALSTLAMASAFAAQPLLPAGHGDQVPARLVSLPAPTGAIERQPVAFSWKLDPALALAQPAPYMAESREYWLTVEGTELQRGVALPMTASGALVRVSPARGATPLRASDFAVSSQGRRVTVDRSADAAALRQAGMDASAGTQVLRLGAGSGAGQATLRAANANGRYVVHVFEPNSALVMFARADRDHALAGQQMRVAIGATSAGRATGLRSSALLVAPDGSSQKVAVRTAAGGGQEAVFKLPTAAHQGGGLWELQVFSIVGGTPRDARTAFAVAQPTARFAGNFALDSSHLRVSLPVQAASPGRYEARGTLYATAPDRSLRAVSEAHAAAWMNAGNGTLVLEFERAHLPAGYGAPYELRQLELNDQGRMAPLESRARAARF